MPKPSPLKVIAKPVDPTTIRRAVFLTLGKRRALMERLEQRRNDPSVSPPPARDQDSESPD